MSALLFEIRNDIAYLTLNRPKVHNAINPELIVQLAEAWKRIAADDSIRVTIITGAGDKAFSAGADLVQRQPMGLLQEPVAGSGSAALGHRVQSVESNDREQAFAAARREGLCQIDQQLFARAEFSGHVYRRRRYPVWCLGSCPRCTRTRARWRCRRCSGRVD